MTIKSFLKLVEIRTKVASVIPLILGILFTVYRYNRLELDVIVLFLISMICIDLATTALNNYMDFRRAIKKDGYNYLEHNAMNSESLNEKTIKKVIIILIIIGAVTGVYLFVKTDWVVLLVGIISFAIGILYSYGPVAISRTPFGELFSGIMMGGFIFFITVYIQVYDMGLVNIFFQDNFIYLNFNLKELIIIFLVSLPLIFMIANIMLSNNICDLDDDKINLRYTLPSYIGRKKSLFLYVVLNIASYLIILVCTFLKILPIASIAVLITLIPIVKNIKVFLKKQDKATTFSLSVKNFISVSLIWILTLFISVIIQGVL